MSSEAKFCNLLLLLKLIPSHQKKRMQFQEQHIPRQEYFLHVTAWSCIRRGTSLLGHFRINLQQDQEGGRVVQVVLCSHLESGQSWQSKLKILNLLLHPDTSHCTPVLFPYALCLKQGCSEGLQIREVYAVSQALGCHCIWTKCFETQPPVQSCFVKPVISYFPKQISKQISTAYSYTMYYLLL